MNDTMFASFIAISIASAVLLMVLQSITFAIGYRIGRYNIVDVTWGLGFVGVAWLALVLGDGDSLRRWLFAILVSVWGLRLTWHVHAKTRGRGEDPRYTELLERSGGNRPLVAARKVFGIQGASQWVVSLPIQVSAVVGPTHGVAVGVLGLGIAMWAIGLSFEAIGDAQLRAFKADPANSGRIMDQGLWSLTRHPNYFGDSCLWWGLWLIAASVWPGVLTVVSPIAMTYFLVFATGARLLEKSMSKRPGYPEYQRRTSYFIPRPPKRGRLSRTDG